MTQMSHMTEVKNDPSLTLSWLGCMFSKQDQNTCSEILKPHLPPFPLMIVAETLVSSIGIWLFVMFAKRSLWREWNDWIYEVRVRFTKQGRVEKNGDQFYAL
jgi:hypothetical protein